MTASKSTMKWAALAVLSLTTFASSTRSVEAKPANGVAKSAMRGKGFAAKKLATKLNLSEAQKTQIQSIMQRARADSQAVKNNSALSQEQKKAQLKTIHSNARSATDAVLTPAQREQLSQMRAERKENRGERRNERREKLNLSDSQKAQIKTIHQRAQSDAQAVRSNTSLSREDKRAQLKAIRANTQSAISALLTPEQRTQKEAMKDARKGKRQERRGERKGERKGKRQNVNNGLNN